MTERRPRLRKLIVVSLAFYAVVLSLVVALHGHWVNERVEGLIWETMLESEMEYVTRKIARDPDFDWSDFDVFHWYDERRGRSIPPALLALPEGIHDEVQVDGKLFAVLVESSPQGRQILALDITDIESREFMTAVVMAGSMGLVLLALTLVSVYGVDRLLRPLTRIADEISTLSPDGDGRKILVDRRAAYYETVIIADAINGFTGRIREHVERERNFVNMASHELRTPIAVLSGVNEVLLDHPETTPAIRQHLLRSRRIVGEMEDLATILLSLARDPSKLAGSAGVVDVGAEVPSIVSDHMHLCEGKELSIAVELDAPVRVVAPLHVVRIAIGNLLRNAIENSDRGVIRVYSEGAGAIAIDDPGQGMTTLEISELYTRMAKSGQGISGGIGIDLIVRICAHFGWALDVESAVGRGTKATLRFGATSVSASA